MHEQGKRPSVMKGSVFSVQLMQVWGENTSLTGCQCAVSVCNVSVQYCVCVHVCNVCDGPDGALGLDDCIKQQNVSATSEY